MTTVIDGSTGITPAVPVSTANGGTGLSTPGSANSVLTSDGVNWLSGPGSLGVGQTWQDVKTTPGRVIGTPYTNTTGRPIAVGITVTINNTASLTTLTVNGIVISAVNGTSTGVYTFWLSGIIPAGASYTLNSTTATLTTWAELR